jgi:hypothetical protein
VIEGVLARGGMGVVYQAWQPQLARRVAIKVVGVSPGISPEDRSRWLRQARAIGRLRHTNVVPLHQAGEQDGCLYLVLDLIAGGSLADRVTDPLPARVAVALMAEIARAVDEIHRTGMLHLDIKPSNILLDGPPDGPWEEVTPMLADFGIARACDDPGATANGSFGIGGTPSFMAPEQIVGDRARIGPRTDVFALGATLYSLLTGRPPFQAASVIETIDLARTREPKPPRTLVPGLPRDLETIALTCLRKDPQRRYASAGALADDLRRWLDGFPIRARRVSMVEHAGRWCRRRPAFATLLAVLAITVASSLVGVLTLWRLSEAERARAGSAAIRALESDKATSGAVRRLVNLLATTVDAPQMLAAERLDEASRVVRALTAKLRRDRHLVGSNKIVAICDFERRLAEALRRRGRYSESHALLTESLELLEAQRSVVIDPDVDEACARTFLELRKCNLEQGQFDAALVCIERAEEALEGWVRDPRRQEAIGLLDASLRSIAAELSRRGLVERRRKLLETHLRMLEQPGGPAIGFFAALTRVELAGDDVAIATLRAAIQRFPAGQRLPERVEAELAEWIASEVDPHALRPNAIGERMPGLEPEAHAARVIRELECKCEAFGHYPNLLPAAAYQVACNTASRGAAQRKAGRLDDACRTARWFSAFAKELARRDANEAKFHMLMCMAFEQESKNAWKVKDYAAIEHAMRNALGEAYTVLRIEPRNLDARLTSASLQVKLFGLTSERARSR